MENKNHKKLKGGNQNMNTQITFTVLLGLLLMIGLVGYSAQASALLDTNVGVNAQAQVNEDSGNGNSANSHADISANANSDNKNKNSKALLAQSIKDLAQASDRVSLDSNDSENVAASLSEYITEIDNSANASLLASSFAQVSHGDGWAISSNNTGGLVQLTFVDKSFVNSTSNDEVTLGRGNIKLSSMPAYNLNLTSETNDTLTFDVIKNKQIVGSLTLNKQVGLTGFAVWSGTFKLNSGDSWSINLATLKTKVTGEDNGSGSNNSSINGSINESNGNITVSGNATFWAKFVNGFKHFFKR